MLISSTTIITLKIPHCRTSHAFQCKSQVLHIILNYILISKAWATSWEKKKKKKTVIKTFGWLHITRISMSKFLASSSSNTINVTCPPYGLGIKAFKCNQETSVLFILFYKYIIHNEFIDKTWIFFSHLSWVRVWAIAGDWCDPKIKSI